MKLPVINPERRFSMRTWTYGAYLASVAGSMALPMPWRLLLIPGLCLLLGVWQWRQRDYSGLAGSSVTLIILVSTYLAAWIQHGTFRSTHVSEFRELFLDIRYLSTSISEVRQATGRLPATLEEVPEEEGGNPGYRRDPWDRDYVYLAEPADFQVISFGRDGVSGGTGADVDWVFSNGELQPEDEHLPLSHFLFATESTSPVLPVALLGALWMGHFVRTEAWCGSGRRKLLTAVGIIIPTVGVCTILAMIYVAAGQSGH